MYDPSQTYNKIFTTDQFPQLQMSRGSLLSDAIRSTVSEVTGQQPYTISLVRYIYQGSCDKIIILSDMSSMPLACGTDSMIKIN